MLLCDIDVDAMLATNRRLAPFTGTPLLLKSYSLPVVGDNTVTHIELVTRDAVDAPCKPGPAI